MHHDDDPVAAFLRQFRPRAPRALPPFVDVPHQAAWWVGIAAMAAALVFAANVRFMPMPDGTPRIVGPGLTIHDMRALLEADGATLDQALMEASTRVLPDVEAPNSAFGCLRDREGD